VPIARASKNLHLSMFLAIIHLTFGLGNARYGAAEAKDQIHHG
jgi:hypothetical protein